MSLTFLNGHEDLEDRFMFAFNYSIVAILNTLYFIIYVKIKVGIYVKNMISEFAMGMILL